MTIRLAALASLAALLVAGAPAKASKRKYDVKSGILELASTTTELNRTIWFDDYGAREAMLATVDGASVKTITASGFEYALDVNAKTGTRRKAKTYAPEVPDHATMTAREKADAKIAELEAKVVAGKTCKGVAFVRDTMSVKAWQWKRVTLYSETVMDGFEKPLVREVTKIETDVPLPAGIFDVPADFEISDR